MGEIHRLAGSVAESILRVKTVEAPTFPQRDDQDCHHGIERIGGDFERVRGLFDMSKLHEAVGKWADEHGAQNGWNMGPMNFARCLFDLGVPGGIQYDLEHEADGALKYR